MAPVVRAVPRGAPRPRQPADRPRVDRAVGAAPVGRQRVAAVAQAVAAEGTAAPDARVPRREVDRRRARPVSAAEHVALCIPTLDAGRWVERMLRVIAAQRLQPRDLIVIDSSSTDGSPARWPAAGARVITIDRDDFDHGGTRNRFLDHTDAPLLIY